MDIGEAAEAHELWGWPVDVLDRLLDLRQRAWRGAVSIEDWRRQDAAARTGLPVVNTEGARELQDAVFVGPDTGLSEEARRRLVGRLTVLMHPAPSDEELWDELTEALQGLDDDVRSDPRLREARERHRERAAAWLTRPGSGIDPASGLSWSRIARFRVVQHPEVGPVPQYVHTAGRLADEHADELERQRAGWVRDDPDYPSRITAPIAELQQSQLTWLPKLLLHAAASEEQLRPLADQLRLVWTDPRTQQVLMRETAAGWPAPYDVNPGSDQDPGS
jgi:hypothetical protein